jgi:hypothetical protein
VERPGPGRHKPEYNGLREAERLRSVGLLYEDLERFYINLTYAILQDERRTRRAYQMLITVLRRLSLASPPGRVIPLEYAIYP